MYRMFKDLNLKPTWNLELNVDIRISKLFCSSLMEMKTNIFSNLGYSIHGWNQQRMYYPGT